MAKKSSGGRGRVRLFFADVEGDDETILAGISALQVAMTKSIQASQSRPVKQLTSNNQTASGIADTAADVDEEFVDGEVFESHPAAPRPKSKRKPPQMSIVKDLNLRPDGQPTLKDFFAELNPETQTQKVALFVYYLQHKADVTQVTANHVFTCFKEVGVKPPNDLPQIIRNTASKHGWVDCSDPENIKITNRGEALIEHDLVPTGDATPR